VSCCCVLHLRVTIKSSARQTFTSVILLIRSYSFPLTTLQLDINHPKQCIHAFAPSLFFSNVVCLNTFKEKKKKILKIQIQDREILIIKSVMSDYISYTETLRHPTELWLTTGQSFTIVMTTRAIHNRI